MQNTSEAVLKHVYFISQSEAERLDPIPGAAMISITDPDKQPATLGQWDHLYQDNFYDGGYSESTIKSLKGAFRRSYASYMDSQQALRLAQYLAELVDKGVTQIYVHCYFGVSRSGAIAMYLQDKHGYVVNKAITKPNQTVYQLLQDPHRYEPLIQSFEAPVIKVEPTFSQKVKNWTMRVFGQPDQ